MSRCGSYPECDSCLNREYDPFECEECVDADHYIPEDEEGVDDAASEETINLYPIAA